jgi:hypothetical protein
MFAFNIWQTHASSPFTFMRDSYHRKFIIEMPVKIFQHLSSIDLSRVRREKFIERSSRRLVAEEPNQYT